MPYHDIPRWEDIDFDAIDYEARDENATGHERTLRSLRSQIDSTEAILNRHLRELGVSTGGDLARVAIPRHIQYRDPFAFDRARKSRSAQSNLRSRRQRFCRVYAQHHDRKHDAEND
ncbi:hypothetical protein [Halorubrum halophilum]|uniref:hypothetical protein n=1 Tax=Halorubrum halophilum TaxID=413816 RepID=UPI00186AE4A9|nr:hypothetical protein [Halorubrum halophilum]